MREINIVGLLCISYCFSLHKVNLYSLSGANRQIYLPDENTPNDLAEALGHTLGNLVEHFELYIGNKKLALSNFPLADNVDLHCVTMYAPYSIILKGEQQGCVKCIGRIQDEEHKKQISELLANGSNDLDFLNTIAGWNFVSIIQSENRSIIIPDSVKQSFGWGLIKRILASFDAERNIVMNYSAHQNQFVCSKENPDLLTFLCPDLDAEVSVTRILNDYPLIRLGLDEEYKVLFSMEIQNMTNRR